MKSILSGLVLSLFTGIILLFFPFVIFGQAPNLGSVANFALFTTTGAVGNTGVSLITGDVGSNAGAISGFGLPAIMVGNIYNADAVTLQASADLASAATQLHNFVPTSTTHAPEFGNGEILLPGVYAIAGAGSITDTLTLDAQNDPAALFIFQIGLAFSTAASTTVVLLNGALASNVFWIAGGAVDMGATTVMKGTVIANDGAVSMAAGSVMEGRMLSTTGAISMDASEIFLPAAVILPLTLIDFKAIKINNNIKLLWTTNNEVSVSRYELERSADGRNFNSIGIVPANNAAFVQAYNWLDNNCLAGANFYRLKMIDIDGAFKYSSIIKIDINSRKDISVYPNPVTDHTIMLQMYGQPIGDHIINLYDIHGSKMMSKKITLDGNDIVISINLDKNLQSGTYYLKINDPINNSKTFKIMVK